MNQTRLLCHKNNRSQTLCDDGRHIYKGVSEQMDVCVAQLMKLIATNKSASVDVKVILARATDLGITCMFVQLTLMDHFGWTLWDHKSTEPSMMTLTFLFKARSSYQAG